jgi:hypothetical protein
MGERGFLTLAHNGEGMRREFLPLKNRQEKITFLYPMLPAVASTELNLKHKKKLK